MAQMALMIPDPEKIKSFRTEAAFENWLRRNHARETELWLRICQKGSGEPSITSAMLARGETIIPERRR